MPAKLEDLVDQNLYAKLKKIRQADLPEVVPDNPYLSDTFEDSSGEEREFRLRNYQRQMLWNLVLMRRFVCGDATGCGKCVTRGTWIRTDRGLERIGDLDPGTSPDEFGELEDPREVPVGSDTFRVRKFYNGGTKPTKTVKTKSGFTLQGTLIHPVKVWDGQNVVWRKLEDVESGDVVCIDRSSASFPEEPFVLDTDISVSKNASSYALPEEMTPRLARLFGYLVGEGTLGSEYSFTISQCPEINPDVHRDILDLMQSCFGYRYNRPEVKDKAAHSVLLRKYLAVNGLGYVKSRERVVPRCILQSPEDCVRGFLRALFEGEGSVKTSGVEITTASETLSVQVHQLLLMFGIVAHRGERVIDYNGEARSYFRLAFHGADAARFKNRIGFVSERKKTALEDALSDNPNTNKDLLWDGGDLTDRLRQALLKATTVRGSNANRKGSGIKQFGRSFESTLDHIRNRGRNPSMPFLTTFREYLEDSGACGEGVDVLNHILDRDFFFDRVDHVEIGEAEVVDLEVEEKHAFVGNGFVNHNTCESLSALAQVWDAKGADLRPLVITELSSMGQWAEEIEKFMDGVRPVLLDGGPRERPETYEDFFDGWDSENPEVLITNYAKPRIDKDRLLEYVKRHPTAIIADESTHFKNISSKTHDAIKALMRHAARAWGLTATLIKNNLEEGYGIFKAVYPNIFGAPFEFREKYCKMEEEYVPGKGYIKKPAGHEKFHIRRFKERIDPFYFGRAKHDVADELPLLTTRKIRATMTSKEWNLYQKVLDGTIEVDGEVKGSEVFEQLAYTQQICNDPALIGKDAPASKKKTFLSLVDNELHDEKVIVFSSSKRMVNTLQEEMENRGWELGITSDGEPEPRDTGNPQFVRVTGDESGAERDAARRSFTDNDNTNMILLTAAGKHALNLQQASVMVFYDLPWSGGNYLQLLGRMIRIGSPHQSVLAIHLLAEGPGGESTIDHHVHETIQRKRDLIDQTLGKRLEEDVEGWSEALDGDIKNEVFRLLQQDKIEGFNA